MNVIIWKGFGRGGLGLTEVLYRHLSGETEENFTNINKILNEPDRIQKTGIPGIQIPAEIYTSNSRPILGPELPVSYAMCTAGYFYGGKDVGA
jgi:hypothetical protein